MSRPDRSLLAFLDAPVVVGDPDGRVVYVNPAFEARFGIPAEAAAGMPLAEILEGGGREALLRAAAESCERGRSVRFALRDRGVGFSAVASPIVAEGARVGVVILLQPDLERVERLRAIQREIADPIDEIQATLDSLLEQTGGRRSQRHRGLLDDGLRAVARLRKWADELRDILAGGEAPPALQRAFDAGEVLRHVLRRLASRVSAGFAFELLVPASLPRARGDGEKLETLLLRMLSNRLDAAVPPAAITLGARRYGRGAGLILSLAERFAPGQGPAPLADAALEESWVAACGARLHVASDPLVGRASVIAFPLAEG